MNRRNRRTLAGRPAQDGAGLRRKLGFTSRSCAVRGAGAVLHTHSMWSTLLSDRHIAARGLVVEGYEMLKGLQGVTTHEHRESIPILENDQDMERLAGECEQRSSSIRRPCIPSSPPWDLHLGRALSQAVRHVEIVEFLLEAVARTGHLPFDDERRAAAIERERG